MKLEDICAALHLEPRGSGIEIEALNSLDAATPSQLSFLENSKYESELKRTEAAAVFVTEAMREAVPPKTIALVVDEPYTALALASALFAPPKLEHNAAQIIVGQGSVIESGAYVGLGSTIGKNSHIMPNVFIGNHVHIGDNTTIYPNATIYRDTHIGDNCIIHSGAVIGADGFGFATTSDGRHIKIHQNGNVIIEDDVEIGANSTIDRAVFSSTIIKKGVRVDNLVQIGHNCNIGEYSVMVAQSGVAGSTTFGHHVVLGGQSAVAGHLEIAPLTQIAARGGVSKDIKESGVYGGFPLMRQKEWLRLQVKISKLLKKG